MLATSATACRVATGPVQPSVSSPFLRLPRELRDEVYDQYFRTDDGFTYDFITNKLKLAGGLPIPLALTLTCRQIHDEVQGLALTLNTITFTTCFHETTRQPAALYHAAHTVTQERKLSLVNDLAPQLLSADMARIATDSYPQFAPVVNLWRSQRTVRHPRTSWGEPPSIWRDFITFVLRLIAKDPRFVELAHTALRSCHGCDGRSPLKTIGSFTQPWIIPSNTDLEELVDMAQVELKLPYYAPCMRYAYSAASSAIRFLQSISHTTRNAIRNIHVLEDRECIASPECHGSGFVSFCQENTKFRVTHVVNLWKNAFPVCILDSASYMYAMPDNPPSLDHDLLRARRITKSVGAWLTEASALPSFGMPRGSYTFVLDGSPNAEHTSEVFRVVQRDVAWQSALDACYARGLLPELSWKERRGCPGYMYEGLPDLLQTLSTQSAHIRTNFDLGHPFSTEDLIEERQGWSQIDWDCGWAEHEPRDFQTKSPLPPWQTLRWQYAV